MKIIIFSPTSVKIQQKIVGGADFQLKKLIQILKKQKHKVTTYTTTDTQKKGTYNWLEAYKHKLECDIFIVYRKALVLPNIKTKYKIFYTQDLTNTPCYDGLREHPEYLEQFDRIICLTNFHKEHLLKELKINIPISIIGNSTEKTDYKPHKVKEKNFIYCSAPHKGLIALARIWKQLYKQLPEYKLHIYSSFKLYGNKDKDHDNFEKIKKLKGIKYHEITTRKELKEQMKKSKLMLYPCTYPETYGNVFNEAMSVRLPIITSNIGSAKEVIGNAGIFIHGNPYEQEYIDNFIFQIKDTINKPYSLDYLQRQCKYRTHEDYEKDIINLIKKIKEEIKNV